LLGKVVFARHLGGEVGISADQGFANGRVPGTSPVEVFTQGGQPRQGDWVGGSTDVGSQTDEFGISVFLPPAMKQSQPGLTDGQRLRWRAEGIV